MDARSASQAVINLKPLLNLVLDASAQALRIPNFNVYASDCTRPDVTIFYCTPRGRFGKTPRRTRMINKPEYHPEARSTGMASIPGPLLRNLSRLPENSPLPASSVCGNYPTREAKYKKLLHFNGRAGIREFLFDGLGLFLADAFLDRLGSAVHKVLGLLQAQAGDFAHGLDHVDLIGARRGQDHVELGLRLGRRGRRSRCATAGHHHRSRGRSRNAQGLFQFLHQLCCFQQRQANNLFLQSCQIRHDTLSVSSSKFVVFWPSPAKAAVLESSGGRRAIPALLGPASRTSRDTPAAAPDQAAD